MDRYEEGPDPNDLEGWRQVIQSGSIRRIRSERLVAAAQKIGPKGDQRILNTLMLEITRRIMGMLRKCVGRQYRDEGWEIVHAAHTKLIEAVLVPKSADGAGLREAFAHRVRLRAVDAVRRERAEKAQEEQLAGTDSLSMARSTVPAHQDGQAFVEGVLRQMKDQRKALAFRLHMQGVPRYSTRVESIATALGVCEETVQEWIKEAKEEIKTILGDGR